jgi:SOS regulatory protein LexA
MSKDSVYLDQLRDYYADHRILPSFAGIGELVGMKSKSAVSAMANRLIESGFLAYAPDRRLQPGKRFFERKIVGAIRAGQPQPAYEALDTCSIDEYLVDTPSRGTILAVKGDSMKDAGILDGDRVVVKTGAPAKPGDIVVAIVDNEFTVKYLAQDRNGFYLRPGNNDYTDIRPKDHLEIYGLVVGVFRKY